MVLEFTFSNPDYQIRHARVSILRLDALADLKKLPMKTKHDLYRREDFLKQYLGHIEGEISDGVSEFTLPESGVYRAILAAIVILRSSDKSEFTVPLYQLKDFEVAQSDLEAGRYKVEISDPLFRITVLDQNGQPVSYKRVGFSTGKMSLDLATDGDGEIRFLGDPSKYMIDVKDEPRPRIRVEPIG